MYCLQTKEYYSPQLISIMRGDGTPFYDDRADLRGTKTDYLQVKLHNSGDIMIIQLVFMKIQLHLQNLVLVRQFVICKMLQIFLWDSQDDILIYLMLSISSVLMRLLRIQLHFRKIQFIKKLYIRKIYLGDFLDHNSPYLRFLK